MQKLLITAAAALLLGATPSFAQSAFDGFYAGATGNFSLGAVEAKAPAAADDHFRGFGGGAFVGWGTSLDYFYLGVEGGIEYGAISFDGNAGGTPYTANRRETGAITARLGFSPAEESLLFLQGGLSLANWTVEDGSTSSEWVDSYRIGIGAEQIVADGMFARLSYDVDLTRDTTAFNPVSLDLTTGTTRLGIGFQF